MCHDDSEKLHSSKHKNGIYSFYMVCSWHVFMSWWRHRMETFSALLAICAGNSPVPGEFPTQKPVTRSFDVYFDLRPNKKLSKHSWGWWFETLSCSLWRHRNVQSNSCSKKVFRPTSKMMYTFKCIVFNEYLRIFTFFIQLLLKSVPKTPNNIRPALVQIMTSHFLNRWW